MNGFDEKLEKRIIVALKKEPATITEISDRLDIHRVTASKYLAVLEAKGEIRCRAIGNAKLFSVIE